MTDESRKAIGVSICIVTLSISGAFIWMSIALATGVRLSTMTATFLAIILFGTTVGGALTILDEIQARRNKRNGR